MQLGFTFQRGNAKFVEIDLLLIAFGIQRDGRRRNILAFHGGVHRERIVGHLAGQLELDVIGLELLIAGKWPVNLLTHHLQIER
ncbi:hypothetical protein D3C73_1455590 [compost metagenome]